MKTILKLTAFVLSCLTLVALGQTAKVHPESDTFVLATNIFYTNLTVSNIWITNEFKIYMPTNVIWKAIPCDTWSDRWDDKQRAPVYLMWDGVSLVVYDRNKAQLATVHIPK